MLASFPGSTAQRFCTLKTKVQKRWAVDPGTRLGYALTPNKFSVTRPESLLIHVDRRSIGVVMTLIFVSAPECRDIVLMAYVGTAFRLTSLKIMS